MSAGGLVFVVSEPIPIGSIVGLKVELPGLSPPIECLARVVRIEKKNEAGRGDDLAVCFLDLSGADREKLDQFVQEEVF